MSKYNNKKVSEDGETFDSKAEWQEYRILKLRLYKGEIENLKVHPVFEIIPAFKRDGKTIRATHYEGDFLYLEGIQWVVEDVKGVETAAFKIKRKLFLCRYPDHELRIVKV